MVVAKCPIPEFNEAKHQYFIDGQKVPGVNEILKSVGLTKDFAGVDTFYRERGIASHKAIEYFIHGELDEETIDPVCAPYLEGFKKWWATIPVERRKGEHSATATEVRLYSEQYGFAGTIDLVLADGIWDYKCSKDPDKASELQGLMYEWLVFENFSHALPFNVLQLPGDGSYTPIESTESANWQLLDAVMRLYQWKVKNVRRLQMAR